MSDLATVSLEAVFKAIPVGLGVVAPDHRIVMMNETFCESLGLAADAIPPGTLMGDALQADPLPGGRGSGQLGAQLKEIIAADRAGSGQSRRRTFAGRNFDLFNTPLPDGGYIVTSVETTVHVRELAEARRRLARGSKALTTLPIGLAIFDSGRRLLLANPRFAALLALPSDRLVAGSSFDAMLSLMEERTEFASTDGSALIASLRYAATGVPWTARRHLNAERSIDIMFDPLPDGACTISINDVTSQVRAEDDAQRRARLLNMVLLNIPHGICVYGPDRRVAMFNDTYTTVMAGAPLQIGDSLVDVIRRRADAGEYGPGEPDAVFSTQMRHFAALPRMRRRIRPNGTAIDIRTAPLPDGGHISVVTDSSRLGSGRGGIAPAC